MLLLLFLSVLPVGTSIHITYIIGFLILCFIIGALFLFIGAFKSRTDKIGSKWYLISAGILFSIFVIIIWIILKLLSEGPLT